MRDHNAMKATVLLFYLGDGLVVEEGETVPQDIPHRCFDENGTLANGDLGCGGDGDEGWVVGERGECIFM